MYQNTKDKDRHARNNADNAMADFKSSKDQLKNDGRKLKNDARDTLDDVRDATHSRSLRTIAHDAGERVQDFISTRREQAHDVRVTAERTIRENPLAVTAAAFAAGAILARLLRRR